MKRLIFALITISILLVGTAMAVDPINATTETQGISTTTGVVVMGTMTNAESVVMTASSMDLRDNPPLGAPDEIAAWLWLDVPFVPLHFEPERQATFSYTESVLADNGYSEFNEMQAMSTANVVANQDNFKSTEQFDYVAFSDAMGRATTSESVLLDLVSQGSRAADRMLCPFATGDAGFIPAYCNVYEMGSSFTGGQVSMITQADTNFIARSADVPTQVGYSVGLSGTGSAAAWINAHVMEGRTAGHWTFEEGPISETVLWNYDMGTGLIPINGGFPFGGTGFMQGVDLVYKEKTTASGVIEAFSKSMVVQDGLRRL